MFLTVSQTHGASAIGDRVLERATRLREMLRQRGAKLLFENDPFDQHGSGIVTFEIPGQMPADFRSRALENHVVVSCRGGGIRASVHVYNNDEDLQRLSELVAC